MAQFDVYKNSNKNTHGAYPYIVDIQSPLISELATRIVIPLGNISHFKNEQLDRLTPEINYNGELLLLLTPQIASVPAEMLKKPIGTLSHFRDEIIASLDFAITGV
ncbi:toxin CcdB [Bathymodiolus platifrons methanotrophic gill symbiont]|uniref:CcdB family protein n=1 Tax=Bathymodiolus platifrons methanotrophic gill symbiont TaxID=113268 RepID=UPI001B5085C2|nr:CcdB family protein [Bathymodiolus platifrons methanotrophic gill symbiont]GFO75730.1 toxin CcdB [Bathymodiolus platifrons methanotrophic gill symbiont]